MLVDSTPSLRGIMLGFVAELQLVKRFLSISKDISYSQKPDDHNRGEKGDRQIIYKGESFVVESKSIQTNSIKKVRGADGAEYWTAKAQVDASDCRTVTFPDGSSAATTCLRTGGFDLLAVNCFAFEGKWNFVFGKNADLPRTSYKKYTAHQQENLLATLVPVTWPPKPPFADDPYPLLEELLAERKGEE